MAETRIACTEQEAFGLLEALNFEASDREFVTKIAQSGAISIDAARSQALPPNAFAYHAAVDVLAREGLVVPSCSLLSSDMPAHYGIVIKDGHPGLCCSRHSCPCTACPYAAAACLTVIDRARWEEALGAHAQATPPVPDGSVPAAGPAPAPEPERRGDFVSRWSAYCSDSERAFKLLMAPTENDFAGAIVSDDDRYVADFIADLSELLVSLGKVDTADPLRRNLTDFLRMVGPAGFGMTDDGLLPARRLIVIDRLGDLKDVEGPMEDKVGFLAEHLGRIVDDRYVVLVGTEQEVSEVVRLGEAMRLAFGGHEIRLAGTSAQEILDAYLANLDDTLREQVDDNFTADFMEFVKERGPVMPYKGTELADYLAKIANSKGRLSLPKDQFSSASVDEMLDSIVGLEQVKATIRELEKFARWRKRLEREDKPLPPANMHMLFEGSPGTGKTMVARLIAHMLHKIGITRLDKCIEVSSKDLIAKYVGHTDKQVHEKVLEALGGVLFIDEAYGLISEDGAHEGSGGFGKQALAELVKCMEDYKDDLIIIFAGYEHEMQELVAVNPGMGSRIGYTFKFEDYTVDQLVEIFNKNVEKNHLVVGEGVYERVRPVFDYFHNFRSFGNGRFVAELVHKANVNHASRLDAEEASADELFVLTADDIPTRQEMFDTLDFEARSADELLEPIVGLEQVKEGVRRLEKAVIYREEAARQGLSLPEQNLNMLFLGNPGTGKTTLARIVGDILYNIGAVPRHRFVEIQAKDLVTSLSGETGSKVTEVVDNAMGGVLFLDEAYALLETGAGTEALAALVKHMSDHKGELVVIFAGYSREMRAFVDKNPGLASRIGYSFEFEDYKPEELQEIFRRKMDKAGLELADGVLEEAAKAFKYFHGVENFGNGRFVDQYIQETISKRALTFDGTDLKTIRVEDLPTVEELCKVVAAAVYDPSDLSGDEALVRVAKHEMGHAICRLARTGKTDIVLVTIEQEGNGALGYVQHKAGSTPLPTSDDLKSEMISLLGGMAAEELCFGQYSAGNSSDLRQATRVAARYVGAYGMSKAGLVQLVDPENPPALTVDKLGTQAIDAMNEVLAECLEDAKRVIQENQAAFDSMSEVLMQEKTISGERVLELWNGR